MDQEHHQMILENRDNSGVENWYCPTCGRRFLLQWPPQYKRIILEPGDELATHSGGKGGLSMGSTEVNPATGRDADHTRNQTPAPGEETNLAIWEEMLNDMNFDRLWDDHS